MKIETWVLFLPLLAYLPDQLKIYTDINDFKGVNKPILTIGTFDGVHLGHKRIIYRLKELKSEMGGETVVFTFDPHPRTVLFPEQKDLKLITTTEEKAELIRSMGIDHLIIFPFTPEFAKLSSEQYIKDFLVDKLHPSVLVIGYDHRFGNNREGNIDTLKKYSSEFNYKVEEIPAHDIDSINVSSTRIRKALEEGSMRIANSYLGYTYFFSGTVIKGKQLGRTLGYPTANLEIKDKLKKLPAVGVYAAVAEVKGNTYKGMMSIGYNPTTDHDQKIKIEINLFDFQDEIYGQEIKINVTERLRDEYKFSSLEELKTQLGRDKEHSIQHLQDYQS